MSDPNGADEYDPDRDPDDMVDEAEDESFPASDPPSFTPGHAGSPDHARDNRSKEGGG